MRSLVLIFVGISALMIGFFLCFPQLEPYCAGLLRKYEPNPYGFATVSFALLAADILLPVPSSIVMFINGTELGIGTGTLISLTGVTLGNTIGFGIGRLSKKVTDRLIPLNDQQKASRIFARYGPFAIILTRGIPVLSEAVTLVSGTRGISALQFLALNTIGYLPVCLLYAASGHYASGRHSFLLAFSAALVVAIIYGSIGYLLTQKNKQSRKHGFL